MYDWTREIIGNQNDNIDLTLLVGNGVDLHSYQPSIQDIAKISTADLFIYVGGESDVWVKDALKNKKNKNMIVLNLMEILGDSVKEEEIVEGMEAEEECEDEDEEEEIEYDEHVWLSLKNAKVICKAISAALCQKDSENAVKYKTNLSTYIANLDDLDAAYSTAVKSSSKNTLIFGDRFPFRYLVDDYGLKYYAAFVGCSAETEASFKTVIFLAKKMDELDSNYIFKIESGDSKLAKTIIQNSSKKNAQVLILDSMQSVTAKQAQSTSYLKIMNENLNVLKQGLK
ncbi:MAG: zinc ABC transporter substrate-binding protein [Treponema sp.]|nr:zinc ABC transporter substrate-binding protein [Treponema sp.]